MQDTAIGVDLGGSKLAAGRVAPDAAVDSFTVSAAPATTAAMTADPLTVIAGLKLPEVVAVGIGVAGLGAGGKLTGGPNIPGRDIE